MTTAPAYVPQFHDLKQGIDYEIVANLSAIYQNSFTAHPIELTENSYVMDHNREEPLELSLTISVSSENCNTNEQDRGVQHIARFYERLLQLRRLQSVDPTEAIEVITGIRSYKNMVIVDLEERRDQETPTRSTFDLRLVQFRYARFPRRGDNPVYFLAEEGPFSIASQRLVEEADRPIIEQDVFRQSIRSRELNDDALTIVRSSLIAIGLTF